MATNKSTSEHETRDNAAKSPEDQPPTRSRAPDAVERLYAYWIISTALLLFVLIIVTVYVCGTLTSQAREYNRLLSDLGNRVAALEVVSARTAIPAVPAERGESRTPPAGPAKPAAQPGMGQPAAPPDRSEHPVPTTGEAQRSRPPADVPPAEVEIVGLLDRAMAKGVATPFAIADQPMAEAALTSGLKYVQLADWSGVTWARLAVLARLLGRDQGADACARRAYTAGDPLTAFAQVSARVLLARGRAREAMMHAEHFADQTASSPASRLLLARVFLALENPAATDELVATFDDLGALDEGDKLTLARLDLELQHWEKLAAVMATLPRVSAELESERIFLQAVALIQQNQRLVEALSLLDFLSERGGTADAGQPAAATPQGGEEAAALQSQPVVDARRPADPPPGPNDYEIATWRGVALMRGGQVEAARQVLDAAAILRADRPEAYYWRAMLEIREGQPETAKNHLQNALATSARFAPAWETLGSLALNTGNLDAAIENLQKAVAANERLASAHFLIAVAHAKASRREPAASALQTALQLDPAYLERAQQTEVLIRLFTADELKALAAPPAETAPAEDGNTPR
jgi:tetratricopeptide (TPR) repeat protein